MEPEAELILRNTASLIRAYGAVAIVGSGISVEAGYPMLEHFMPLLRHALFQDPKCRADLGAEFQAFANGAQEALDEEQLRRVYASIARHPSARRALQQAFALRDREQTEKGCPEYMVGLARLLHTRSIIALLSLNWDSQVEAAYEQEYGRKLTADGPWLIKPHGDALHPEVDWVLPSQPSNLSAKVLMNVRRLAEDRVRVLLVLGYSQQDEEIVSEIIRPLAERWQVVRIGPGLNPPNVAMTASQAIPRLCNELGLDDPPHGWEYVRFRQSDGLAHALSGRGMVPGDAVGCPTVPEVGLVIQELKTNHSALLLGESGSGKSLIAYQAAMQMSRNGWEVVQLRPNGAAVPYRFPHPTLMIVDDAQARPERWVRSLFQEANESAAVLVVSNEEIAGIRTTVKVAARRSVSILAEWMRKNIEKLKPYVTSLDRDVGDGYFQVSLERRIDEAVEHADKPWNFNFILTGGWRRAREELARLKEERDADLVLFTVAAGQFVSADLGLTEVEVSRILSHAGIVDSDRDSALDALAAHKLISDGPRLRCPHLRYAGVVVEQVCANPTDVRWDRIEKILEGVFDATDRTVFGYNKLLFELNFSEGFRLKDRRTAMSSAARLWVSESIWKAKELEDVKAGLFALERLQGWLPDFDDQIQSNLASLARFIESADETTAHAVANFVNWFSQHDATSTERLFRTVSAMEVAGRFAHATPENAFALANLLSRLANCAPKAWAKRMRKSLPWERFEMLIDEGRPTDMYSLAELVYSSMDFRDRRWKRAFELLTPKLAYRVNEDPLAASTAIDFGLWNVLALPRFRRFWSLIDPESFGNAVSRGAPRDWHSLQLPLIAFSQGYRSRAKGISFAINFDQLLTSSDRFSDERQAELVSILFILSITSDPRPILGWMQAFGDRFDYASRELAILLPGRAIELVRMGGEIHLRMDGNYWGAVVTVRCLRALAEFDLDTTRQVLLSNVKELREALTLTPSASSREGISDLLRLVLELAPGVVDEALSGLDTTILAMNWRGILDADDIPLRSLVTDLIRLYSPRFPPIAELSALVRDDSKA